MSPGVSAAQAQFRRRLRAGDEHGAVHSGRLSPLRGNSLALLPEGQAASYVEALPGDFWTP